MGGELMSPGVGIHKASEKYEENRQFFVRLFVEIATAVWQHSEF